MQTSKPRSSLTTSTNPECRAKRNRFFRGKRMKAEEFSLEQAYAIGRRRLINRSVLGWGVVAGLKISQSDENADKEARFVVSPGFALDSYGRELELAVEASLGPDNTFLLTGDGKRAQPLSNLAPGRYVLALHYAERQVGDANLADGCGCDRPEKNFVCETTLFSLRPLADKQPCPCVECGCERECGCGHGSCCADGPGRRGCVCAWISERTPTEAVPRLCEWNGYHVGIEGVELACVEVKATDDRCKPFRISAVEDDCGPRRLLKSNDVLFDLLRGCDLVHIAKISWADWYTPGTDVAWGDFVDAFDPNRDGSGKTALTVTFSGPVQTNTLRWDVVAITVYTVEQSTGWRIARRVPVVDPILTPEPPDAKLPKDTTNQLRVCVRKSWLGDELKPERESWLSERGFIVEIEVRGDLILDCRGQAVDANAVGRRPTPTGNGTPGGTFLSSFRVSPKPIAAGDLEP